MLLIITDQRQNAMIMIYDYKRNVMCSEWIFTTHHITFVMDMDVMDMEFGKKKEPSVLKTCRETDR
jgi:hypothetical protein